MGGRTLRFRLFGINNQNFIMRDEQTGSWWQQVTGRAILGPLAGESLEAMPSDQVTFAVWKREHPGTLVLLGEESAKPHYASADWEKKVGAYPTPGPADPDDVLKPRDLVVGVRSGAFARAYPWGALDGSNPIADTVGGTPVLILRHPDGRSLRCFDRRIDGETLDLSLEEGSDPPVLRDGRTNSEWDFSGLAVAGPMAGRRLARVACLEGYWFDWKTHNPGTEVFAPGRNAGPSAAGPA